LAVSLVCRKLTRVKQWKDVAKRERVSLGQGRTPRASSMAGRIPSAA